jgi:acyl-[acyl-carrier-protein]-phospholipid O-acyltransferase/long-chain-fatty-acid--[acyl-carrier-protein] ligase
MLRYLVVGAEKLGDDVRKLVIDKFGARILEGYGATECAPVISLGTPLANQVGTVGELLPGMQYKIQPVTGIEGGGALHVKGPNIMLGYLKHDKPGVIESPQSEFGPGWYNTGDVVSVEGTGFIRILGRIRRFAKVAGEMVSLELVEKIAVEAQPKFQHASTSVKDASRGETILLFTQDPELRREHLQAAVKELGAPEIAIPRRIIHVDKLPMLGNGKKDYVTLAKMAQEMQQAAVKG